MPDSLPKPPTLGPNDTVSSVLALPDGRQLGYAQFGAPDGRPIIVHHGMACSRFDGEYFHEVGLELNARIIGIDRAGQGLSTANPKRTLLEFAEDVKYLIEHLKLPQYAVMGISGGGPSTLACAYSLPADKLKAISMVVALGGPDLGMSGAQISNQIGYGFMKGYKYVPSWINKWFWSHQAIGRVDLNDQQRLKMIMDSVAKNRSSIDEKEIDIVSDEDFHRIGLRSTREGFSQGYDGVLRDGQLCVLNFGFRLEDIRQDLPIYLWYGKRDILVPPIQGKAMEKRLGDRAILHLEDETHISIMAKNKKKILEELVAHFE